MLNQIEHIHIYIPLNKNYIYYVLISQKNKNSTFFNERTCNLIRIGKTQSWRFCRIFFSFYINYKLYSYTMPRTRSPKKLRYFLMNYCFDCSIQFIIHIYRELAFITINAHFILSILQNTYNLFISTTPPHCFFL